jgi:hypothetical protein
VAAVFCFDGSRPEGWLAADVPFLATFKKTKGVKFNQCGWVDVLPKSFELLVSGTGAV